MNATAISVRVPIIALVVAATAVPVELQPLGWATISFRYGVADVAANIAGYLLVGVVLAEFGWTRALLAAALLSSLAEASQMVMVNRVASVADVTTNLSGAALGILIAKWFQLGSPALAVNRRRAIVAVSIAVMILAGTWNRSGRPLNARGATVPGTLEAQWNFDEPEGRRAADTSGHQLHGTLSKGLQRVAGIRGGAVTLDGKGDGVSLGRDTAFRLVGSMTVSAWIHSTSYPRDDAAVVSTLGDKRGFQLDTTIDRGPRTIGFKLNDPCGDYMARYGATPLSLGTWYHIAGVYDAERQSLDVYLNGELDNGTLRGVVSGNQRSAGGRLYIGRRSNLKGYEFAGMIDDVRIYSFALTKAQVIAVGNGATIPSPAQPPKFQTTTLSRRPVGHPNDTEGPCGVMSERADTTIPTASGLMGVLVAFACIGLWPTARVWLIAVTGLLTGGFLAAVSVHNLPAFNLWLVPLTSLAGSMSVAISRRDILTKAEA